MLAVGQRQLLANYARALATIRNPDPWTRQTSSVDTETEIQIRKAIERLMEVDIHYHRAPVVHDSAVRQNHRHPHKRRVSRDRTTHQELLARRGIYYKLYHSSIKTRKW